VTSGNTREPGALILHLLPPHVSAIIPGPGSKFDGQLRAISRLMRRVTSPGVARLNIDWKKGNGCGDSRESIARTCWP
jgi:hypothetical protein